MSNSILYINGTYLCQWTEFEAIMLSMLNSKTINKSQDDVFASLRDGVVYDWMLERNLSNADNFHPKNFINTTDFNVRQYLIRLFCNIKDVVNSLNIDEYIELDNPFSIEESNSAVTEGFFNQISKISGTSESIIHIRFKVKRPANEEFSINVFGNGKDAPIKLDNFKISTRIKADCAHYKLNVKDLARFNTVTFIVDGNEIISFKLLRNNWLESETVLLPMRFRQITIICDRNDVRLVIPRYGNEILKKGKNTITFTDRPNLIKGFGFDGNKSGIRQILLSDIDTSQCTTMYEMFRDCNNISQLFMGRFNTSNVSNLSGMFQNCSSLKTLDLTTFDTSKVTDMSFMFSGCGNLFSVNMDSFDTSNVSNMNMMFSNCESLSSIDLRGFNTSHVKDMNGMFENCTKIKDLDLSNFDTSNVSRFEETFLGCSNLISLNLSGWIIKSAYNIFMGCEKLRSIYAIDCSPQTVDKIKEQLEYAYLRNVQIITKRPSIVNIEEQVKDKVSDFNISRLVDMGTSVLWNSCNLGAEKGYDEGDYYSWGALNSSDSFGSNADGYKQVNKDNISGLQEFDAARYMLGEGYRIPTVQEWEELLEICEFRLRTITIKGRKFVKLVSTKTKNQLLLPLIGHMEYDVCNKDYAQYWTSEQYKGKYSYICQIHETSWNLTYAPKWNGLPIRPVFDPHKKPTILSEVEDQDEQILKSSRIAWEKLKSILKSEFPTTTNTLNKTYPPKSKINESNVYIELIKDCLPYGKQVFENDKVIDIGLNLDKLNSILDSLYHVKTFSPQSIKGMKLKDLKTRIVSLLS